MVVLGFRNIWMSEVDASAAVFWPRTTTAGVVVVTASLMVPRLGTVYSQA